MENIQPILKNEQKGINKAPFSLPSSFITWNTFKFPLHFLDNYLAELLKANIIDDTDKKSIEVQLWDHNWRPKRNQDLANPARIFPALFRKSEPQSFEFFDAFNQKIQLQLAQHAILPIGDFIDTIVNKMTTADEWSIIELSNHHAIRRDTSESTYESYYLLDCYTQIYTFSAYKELRLIPALLEKSIAIGHVDLTHWCLNGLKKPELNLNVYNKKESPVLEVAFGGLSNHLRQSEDFDFSFLEHWDAIVKALVSSGANPPSMSKLKSLFKPSQHLPLRVYQEQPGKENAFPEPLYQTFASLLSTLLVMSPPFSTPSSPDRFLIEVWKTILMSIPSGHTKAILAHFISRYTLLNLKEKPLANESALLHLLDWLGTQAFSKSEPAITKLTNQLIDTGIKLSDINQDLSLLQKAQARWDNLVDQLRIFEEPKNSLLISQGIKLAAELLNARVGLAYVDEYGMTLLHKAVQYGWSGLAETLLQAGVCPNRQTLNGHTALHLALLEKHKAVDMIEVLLKHPAIDLMLQDNHGWTSLHYLVMLNLPQLLNFFIKDALEKNRTLPFATKTSWGTQTPLQNTSFSKTRRWSIFLVKAKAWGTHQKTPLEMDEIHNGGTIRKILWAYENSKKINNWALQKRYQEKPEIMVIPANQKPIEKDDFVMEVDEPFVLDNNVRVQNPLHTTSIEWNNPSNFNYIPNQKPLSLKTEEEEHETSPPLSNAPIGIMSLIPLDSPLHVNFIASANQREQTTTRENNPSEQDRILPKLEDLRDTLNQLSIVEQTPLMASQTEEKIRTNLQTEKEELENTLSELLKKQAIRETENGSIMDDY